MSHLKLERFGGLGVHDTGALGTDDDYTTLAIIHGFSYHSGQLKCGELYILELF